MKFIGAIKLLTKKENIRMEFATVAVSVNKSSSLRIAKKVFLLKKRCTEVMVKAHNVNVLVSYSGKREEDSIDAGMTIVRVIKK